MKYRKMDTNGDYTLGLGNNGQYKDIDAVAQSIKTRLLHLQEEWWEDLNRGLPFFQQIAGRRGNETTIGMAQLLINEIIRDSPGVTAVRMLEINMMDRDFFIRYSVDTIYGEIENVSVVI